MTADDLWGSDDEEPDFSPPDLPPGMRAVQLIGTDPRELEDIQSKYAKLAGRPETTQYAKVVTDKLNWLSEMADGLPPDEVMGTFGVVAKKLGFHGETIKMAAKFESDESIRRAIPAELFEVIQAATKLNIDAALLFEIAFCLGYALAQDGSIAVSNV